MNTMIRSVLAAALCGCASASVQEPAVRRDFPAPESLPERKELPDPLVKLDGVKVADRAAWERERKPELKALFQHYMYGWLPPAPAKTEWSVRRTDPKAYGGKATLKEVSIRVAPEPCPAIELLVVVPNARRAPAPAFVGLNFTGNHSLTTDPAVALPKGWIRDGKFTKNNRATEEGRGTSVGAWSIEQTIDAGFATSTFYYGDGLPDKNDFKDGIYPHVVKVGADGAPAPTEVRAIAFWAWTVHRAVDYLVKDPDIDAKRIAVTGHSRNGKASLVAAAFDERIALAIPHQAGCGGTAPSRSKNPKGEPVHRINTAFPHWFNANFKAFNQATDRLPFDQHALLALCAPRPVLYSNAEEDQWADPGGQFEMLQAAEPVYKLCGSGGLAGAPMPPQGTLGGGALGYYIRAGKHSMTPEDWRIFVEFAVKNLGKP
jgi:hypothetical protein